MLVLAAVVAVMVLCNVDGGGVVCCVMVMVLCDGVVCCVMVRDLPSGGASLWCFRCAPRARA